MTARAQLDALRAAGALGDLDVHLADTLGRLAGGAPDALLWAAALASQRTGAGHVCVDLARVAGGPLVDGVPGAPVTPDLARWTAALRATSVVGGPDGDAPLVLDAAGRLYLRRYWQYERDVADDLRRRAAAATGIDPSVARAAMAAVWPRDPRGPSPDWQRIAAAVAALRRLCVISGGPGTGKTSTVVRLLALLAAAGDAAPVVELAAPTGKAAARLEAAVQAGRENLPERWRAAIPERASTVHRLLRLRPDSTRAGVDRAHPLRADVVVVDEASMVDLALMAKLVGALRPEARLVLLGDKDQLASVEAGAVLGDVCGDAPGLSPVFAEAVGSVVGEVVPAATSSSGGSPLSDAVVALRHSRRFAADSGIAQLAAAVNAGDADATCRLLASPPGDVAWQPIADVRAARDRLARGAVEGFAPYLRALRAGAPVSEVLQAFDRFRILCAHRAGGAGVAGVNRLVEEALETHGLLRIAGPWYVGRPVMVTRNDHGLRLANGDVGIVLPDPEDRDRLVVEFPGPDGGARKVPPARLPPHETVFAMTVHKSQGSEFDRVLLLLPGEPSRVVTRELLYTALTRAKQRIEVWAAEAVVRAGVASRIERSSGLRDALWHG